MAAIDVDRAEAVAALLKKMELRQDDYLNPEFYPPPGDSRESQLAYFTAMVAIDHRTSTPWESFEGYIGGRFYHGADALYRLGRILYDSGFFTAERLAQLTPKDAAPLFTIGGKTVWDFYTRVYLLRDLGGRAVASGGFEKMLPDTLESLQRALAKARAYEDPVGKKVMLLAKFLHGRRLVEFRDVDRAEVAVDNHLSRVAYRLGIVEVDYDFLTSGVEVSREEDIKLREVVKTAWRIVSRFGDIHPFKLDDYLWKFGRSTCSREKPQCGACLFREVCKAHALSRYPPEHLHLTTWYY